MECAEITPCLHFSSCNGIIMWWWWEWVIGNYVAWALWHTLLWEVVTDLYRTFPKPMGQFTLFKFIQQTHLYMQKCGVKLEAGNYFNDDWTKSSGRCTFTNMILVMLLLFFNYNTHTIEIFHTNTTVDSLHTIIAPCDKFTGGIYPNKPWFSRQFSAIIDVR